MGFVCKCGNTEEFSCIYEHYSETVDGEANVLDTDGNISIYRCKRCQTDIEPEEFQAGSSQEFYEDLSQWLAAQRVKGDQQERMCEVETEEEGRASHDPEA